MSDNQASLTRVGYVLSANDPLLTLRFDPTVLPRILARLTAEGESLCVVKVQPDGTVHAVAASGSSYWTPGQAVADTGEPFSGAVPDWVAANIINRQPREAPTLRTGLKSIDVFAPLIQDGGAGVFAEWGVGVLVLLPELLRRLGQPGSRQLFFVFVPPIGSEKQWSEVNSEVGSGSDELQVFFVPVADPVSPEFEDRVTGFDTKLVLSRTLARQGIYPSIDPLRSRSRDQSATRTELAEAICDLVSRSAGLQSLSEPAPSSTLDPEGCLKAHRAGLALRFLSQPFFVAEPYTGIPGVDADTDATVQTFSDILSGLYDNSENIAFTMTGAAPKQT